MRWVLSLLVAAAACLAGGAEALAARRLALVIGNDAYAHLPALERAVSDARAYRDVLSGERGFEVFFVENGTRDATFATLFRFLGEIQPGDVAMVVYSGHGVQLDPERRDTLYLLPTDMPNIDPGAGAESAFLEATAINFARISGWVAERGARLRIFVLDACRDNPFAARGVGRSIGISRGLGRIGESEGEFVFFAAGPGQQALDRLPGEDPALEPNSVFTRVFLDHFRPGTFLEDIANDVQEQVRALARSASYEQLPWYSDGVGGKTCLDEECGAAVASVDPGFDAAIEETYWRLCEANTNPAYCDAYLATFPQGPRALLAQLRKDELVAAGGPVPTPPPPPPPEEDPGRTVDPGAEDDAGLSLPGPTPATGRGGDGGGASDRAEAARAAWAALAQGTDMAAIAAFRAEYPFAPEADAAAARLAFLTDLFARGQRELNRIGYPAGTVDGVWGRRSAGALSDFQRANGLPVTGEMTERLLDRLVAAPALERVIRTPEPTRAPDVPRAEPTPVPGGGPVVVADPVPTRAPEPSRAPERPSGTFGAGTQECDELQGGPAFARECY